MMALQLAALFSVGRGGWIMKEDEGMGRAVSLSSFLQWSSY
jgi:hypothetical protein